ncbi:MAG: hypothetical protein QW745_03285 [Thermoplasmata archaeon]
MNFPKFFTQRKNYIHSLYYIIIIMRQIKMNKNSENKITVNFPYDQSSKTTEIYTHVSNRELGKIKSPLDFIIKGENKYE